MQNTGQLEEAARELARLRELPLDDAVRAFVCWGSAWAAYAQARTDEVAPLLAAMLDALEHANDPQVWDRCFFVSLMTGLPGMRPLLERFAAGAMRLTSGTPTQLRASVMHIRTWLAFSQGDIDAAAQWLARADEDCRWLGRPRSLMTESWMSHTLIDAVRGDGAASYTAAQENKRDLEETSFLSNRLTHEYEELFTYIRASWLIDDEATLRTLDAAIARTGNAYEWAAAPDDRRFTRAFIALFENRLADARELLQPLARDIERSCFFPATQARVMLADVEQRMGLIDAAAATLRPWCEAVHAGGDVGGALLAGPQVLQRLAAAPWGDRLLPADKALLVRLQQRLPARGSASTPAATMNGSENGRKTSPPERASPTARARAKAFATLSEREHEVLARIAAGDSNKLIARAFDLSPHTVKRHVANILDKLGVDTRGQAAARWQEHAGD